MYKLIVSDFDDTLLKSDKTLSEHTLQVIKALKGRGIHFTFCSGRMYDSLRRYINALEIDIPVISYNGAMIVNPLDESIMEHWSIELPLAKELCARLEGLGLYIQAYMDDKMYCREITDITRMYTSVTGSEAHPLHSLLSESLFASPTKIITLTHSEEVKKLLPVMREQYKDKLVVTVSNPQFLEFISPRAGKGSALKLLCERMNIERGEVLAFGDSLNDLSMLEYAGHAVAVGNARPDVKAAADEICLSNDEDGVAVYIERLLSGMRG